MLSVILNLCKEAEIAIRLLERSGHQAYVVGGCVRDLLLGTEPKDWDICTSALPEQIVECFDMYTVTPTGLKHGTVTVIINGTAIEITTFRIDGDYADGRHPEKVSFTDDVALDLSRRDFTINAMAYNPNSGLVDHYDGQEDLAAKTIRCVGNADCRFEEDGLRILRALRFASALGFDIEKETEKAIHKNVNLLGSVSAERIKVEFDKLLQGRGVADILLDYSDIISYIIPEMQNCVGFSQNNKYHCYDVYEHIVRAVENYKGDDLAISWALFFHDIGKPHCYTEDDKGSHFHGHPKYSVEIAAKILDELKFDNKTKEAVIELVRYHDIDIPVTQKSLRRAYNKLGEERVRQLYEVKQADIYAHRIEAMEDLINKLNVFKNLLDNFDASQECFTRKRLAINGKDITQLGVICGPDVGKTIQMLLDDVIDGKLPNEHTALVEKAKTIIEKEKFNL